jgi:hypothetical protein
MMPKYPALIYTADGPEAIARGHGLSIAQIEAAEREVLGELDPGRERVVQEVNFRFVSRIKWCANLDGFGCDQEGEWHGHWTEVRPNPSAPNTAYTLIRHQWPDHTNRSEA